MDKLKAVVMIKVIPARNMMILKSFIKADFPILVKVGNIDNRKLIGKNIAYRINKTCEKIMIPVSKKIKIEIPILNKKRKKTVPNRVVVLVNVKF